MSPSLPDWGAVMINDRARQAVDASTFGGHFRKPLYDGYNFVQVPRSLNWLYTGEGQPGLPADVFGGCTPPFQHVVLCFIDAFGWQHVEAALSQSRFLQHASKAGVLSKMTAMFPSTTAAHVTAIHTGMAPAESGMYSWPYREPTLGMIIESLPFGFPGMPRESLRGSGVDPNAIYPGPNIYGALSQRGVRSFVFQSSEIANSTCNSIYNAGAEKRSFRSLAEALVGVRNTVLNESGCTYTYLYWDRIDSLSHAYGANSEQVAAEVEMVWQAFDRLLHDRLAGARRTLVLVVADHGHMENGSDPVLINRDFPEVVPLLEKDRLGQPLSPGGSSRDCFLYVQPDHLETVLERLRPALADRAEVYRTTELIAQGFFGPGNTASERFLARVGNLAILPYAQQSVWWWTPTHTPAVGRSSHGGLTPEEMEIPLFVVPYD